MKENLEGGCSSRKGRHPQGNGEAYMSFRSGDDEEEEHVEYSTRRGGKRMVGERGLAMNLNPLRSLGYVDPGWEHGIAQDDRKKKVKCNYCDKVVSGGVNRFKQHLARIPGEVAPCNEAPKEVYLQMKEHMKWHRRGRRGKQLDAKDVLAFSMPSDNEDEVNEQEEDALHRMNKERLTIGDKRWRKDLRMTSKGMSPSGSGYEPLLKRSRLDSAYLKTPYGLMPTACKQVNVKKGSGKSSRKEVTSAICKFFYDAGVPLQAANSQYFRNMLELVGQYGEGLAGPSSKLMSCHLLQEEIATIRNNLVEYRASWGITGCSIMADSWLDTDGRTLINFLVSSPHGLCFVSSVDATDMVEDELSLFKLLDKVVEETGEENVVQVITKNTLSYKAAGKMLEEKRRNLFWTPCATNCIDQMLEDFLKIKCVGECMEKAKKITKFVYNQIWLLNLLKKEFMEGQELLRPSVTRYASSFATLRNLLDHRIVLRRMFQSNMWTSSRLSKSDEGKEVERIVSNAAFWKKALYVLKSVNPITQVLQKVDTGKSLSVPYIYNEMYRAKLAIKSIHGDDVHKYGPFWNVIDNHWNSLIHHPLYVAAYFLNPSYRYHPQFVAHAEVVRGLNECIVRLEPDSVRRISAMSQISDYSSAKADFGTELAISTRTELGPAAWWQQHGISGLELQHIAVRILSQTCSSIGCEHNWSIYDQVRSQGHSRVAQKRIDDLIYVHYNLRLRECHIKKKSDDDSITLDNALQAQLLDDWIVNTEKQALQDDEETFYDENGTAYNDVFDYEDGNTREARNGSSMELLSLADVESSLEVNAAKAGAAGFDYAADMEFCDEDFE
ncbi:hypothetical protein Ddye_021740 [Dipteronia dyeriana]|uniref:BED-type domain-containing protein n=1 Tax=Dipteronia dyeriana TaxID=168575 RepID=A0AAD9WYA3_9ROSI|nr:hypothetical protein Ddye_021740 [Dipteronia dyeriana]